MSTVKEYIELADETLVSLAEACSRFPVPISRPTIERLWRRGQRGVLLRTIFLCGRRFTSQEEIRRFCTAIQNDGDGTKAAPVASTMPKRDIEAGRRRFNLPVAGKNGVAANG